jgi:hypothetical protein
MATFTPFFASRTQHLFANQNQCSLCLNLLPDVSETSHQENKMNYLEPQQIAPTFQSNSRAEDGQLDCSRWSGLCEGVLIPLGSLFAVFLLMLGVMLITT